VGLAAPAQVNRPRNPPPDGPWSGGHRDDPTDPNKQTEERRRLAQEYFDAGMKLLEKKQIQAAKGKFRAAVELVGKEGVGQAAIGQLTQIHTEGMKQLEKAGLLFQAGKYQEALQLAKKTKTLYGAIFDGIQGGEGKPNVAQLAAKMIKVIEADPKAKAEIDELEAAKRYAKAARLEEGARKDETKYYDLYKTLQGIVKRYPNSPTGVKAAEQLGKLKADKKLYAVIEKEQQRRFISSTLQQAEQYEKAGQSEEAAAEYQKLKKKFPDKTLDELRRMAEKAGGAEQGKGPATH
jgi:tetratricopeptide (TPR) repeat protein